MNTDKAKLCYQYFNSGNVELIAGVDIDELSILKAFIKQITIEEFLMFYIHGHVPMVKFTKKHIAQLLSKNIRKLLQQYEKKMSDKA